jgi:alkanesulfonate monooxygenase SsuD/methylene tetrahydromethanopterin reductase-like flavin-dependent oxidoreductase (luciferase family)
MDIGIGLPNAIAGVDGPRLVEWARRADAAGFSTLGTIDRLVYPNYESLVSLAAAAAVTERIRLATSVLLAPARASAGALAKQCATLQHLSGGRLSLGMAVGARPDDYELAGVPFEERGRRFDAMLDEMAAIWRGERGDTGPDVSDRPPRVVIGGHADASFRRAARHDGWILGGGAPDTFREGRERLEGAWSEAGRDGRPYAASLAYFALGPTAAEDARRGIGGYYAWLGEYADRIVDSAAKDEATVKGYVEAFAEAGADELILFPGSPDPEQVDLLARAVL